MAEEEGTNVSTNINASKQSPRGSAINPRGSLSNPRASINDMMQFDLEYAASHTGLTTTTPDYLLLKNQITSPENIALFQAALEGDLAGVNSALSQGAKPNYFCQKEDGKDSLHVAAEKGYIDIVDTLLSNGAVVDCKVATSKSTALSLSCGNCHFEVAQMLIGAGANTNLANSYGNRALHEAAKTGNQKIVRSLLNAGADPNAANKKGSTPLHFFCYGEREKEKEKDDDFSVETARILLDAGADVTWRDHNGYTPLLVCCTTGRLDIILLLIEYGADPTVKDNNNRSVTDIAKFYKRDNIIQHFATGDAPYSRFG
mmetsp:Transcript_13190/g.13239  ORF Transcript_13190/g.13239 Transcript_13190/m.13239 type:complete len:316 (+) Transcript_13190:145-1092(+)